MSSVIIEYSFIAVVLLIFSYSLFSVVQHEHELSVALCAAKSGANLATTMNNYAVYPTISFDNYTEFKPELLSPSVTKIIKIEYKFKGYNERYKKFEIELQVYAHVNRLFNNHSLRSLGDRINYNVRKSICEVFGTGDKYEYYDPAFSQNFVFITPEVKWV